MSFSFPYKGPIPPWTNAPINAQFYKPSVFVISDITLGLTTIVTTSLNNNYVVGQEIRLTIPPTFGCRQLNGQSGFVISIPSANQVQVSINSVNADQFTSSSATTKPQIAAIGDINNGAQNTSANNTSVFIPGSFINIS